MKHDEEPLSLEQLRLMDGQPVWCEYIGDTTVPSQWMVVDVGMDRCGNSEFEFVFDDTPDEEYGKTWLAYTRKPIDFETWKPCGLCKRLGEADPCYKDRCFRENAPQCGYRCDKFLKWRDVQRRLRKAKFCPECGRPLTLGAREQLNKRIREG